MKAKALKLQAAHQDPRIADVLESQRELQDRVEQLAEEVRFLKELKAPGSSATPLPAPGQDFERPGSQ